MTPRLLDLFCCEGGAAMGYQRAGFEVVGVDLERRPRYPFEFHQGDALEFLEAHAGDFDAVHASPPCQAYSITRHAHGKAHPDLVGPTRAALEATGLPYVIENVPGAPLRDYVTLCGAAMGCEALDVDSRRLVLRRHRLFESNVALWAPPPCACADYRRRGYTIGGVYGGGSVDLTHARGALVRVVGGPDLTVSEAEKAAEIVGQKINPQARIIWGCSVDDDLDHTVRVLLVITGVKSKSLLGKDVYTGPVMTSSEVDEVR